MSKVLKVLIVTPTYFPDVTGNAVTAHRLYKGLRDKGVEVEIFVGAYCNTPLRFKPDVIHALHALKGGVPAMEMAKRLDVPFVVTITGTDLHVDLLQSENSDMINVFDKAAMVITYTALSKERLLSRLPSLSKKITVIRPSVEIEKPKGEKRLLPDGFNFFLPSGIRRVKDPSFAIKPLEKLRKEIPSINLTIAGPVLDEVEWKNLSGEMRGKDWVYYMKAGFEEMPDLYNSADVVLNTSISEGLSNAVLEAMFLGKGVLASDCDGNRAAVTNGVEGLLYKLGDEEDFLRKAKSLVLDPDLRERMGRAGIDKAGEYTLPSEIEGHLRLYREMLGSRT